MKLKIVPVYSSKEEEYRLRWLRQRIARRGISVIDTALNVMLGIGLLLVVIGGMAADSECIEPTLWLIGTGAATSLGAWALKERLEEE